MLTGRSPCGGRGLKLTIGLKSFCHPCRSPCGGRGLKRPGVGDGAGAGSSLPMRGAWIETPSKITAWMIMPSLPMRGAWIETQVDERHCSQAICRSPCGGRGLKHAFTSSRINRLGRSPCGGRGLKLMLRYSISARCWSLPMRGAWIETACRPAIQSALKSLPMRGAWIETSVGFWTGVVVTSSLPMRGAWIETRSCTTAL